MPRTITLDHSTVFDEPGEFDDVFDEMTRLHPDAERFRLMRRPHGEDTWWDCSWLGRPEPTTRDEMLKFIQKLEGSLYWWEFVLTV